MSKKNIIIIVVVILVLGGLFFYKNDSKIVSKKEKVKIVESKASKLKLVDYKSDVFNMKVPDGYKVESTGTGVYYAIHVYDPDDSNNSIFLMKNMTIIPILYISTMTSSRTVYIQFLHNIFVKKMY